MQNLNKLIQAQFNEMCDSGNLYVSEIYGSEVWDVYLNSFENDPVFRNPESSIHNCNHCKNFIRRYGNIVSLDKNNNIVTMFDVDASEEYSKNVNNMSKLLKSHAIKDVFVETYDILNILPYEKTDKNLSVFSLGVFRNIKRYTAEEAAKFGVVKPNETKTFNHMAVTIPRKFINFNQVTANSIIGEYRTNKEVLHRSLQEIDMTSLLTVRDLIEYGSLLNSADALDKVNKFIDLKIKFDAVLNKENWVWSQYKNPISRFGNELIGVLCKDLSKGVDVVKACKDWNYRVDPINYMKVKSPITKGQIEQAEKFITENGYIESFDRRLATLEDIKISDILHINEDVVKVSIFDSIKTTNIPKNINFDNIREISIDDFMNNVLPECSSVEVFFDNKHVNNLVSLTTSNNPDSKRIMKWDNNYSWTYNGDLAGKSEIKDMVKSRGGHTENFLRISLYFPDTDDDYDLHLHEPNGTHIYYNNLRRLHTSSAMLDLDAQGKDGKFPPEKRVENLTYSDILSMPKGRYDITVNNFSRRSLKVPFYIEIENQNKLTKLKSKPIATNTVDVFSFLNDGFDIEIDSISDNMEIISSYGISKTVYGINTNEFHKVNLMCLSPNYWNSEIGNKHYFFMLEKCKVSEDIRSFHNENLISDLLKHRKVLDVLGETQKAKFNDNQLSGLGFNATVRDELVVRCKRSYNELLKIKF